MIIRFFLLQLKQIIKMLLRESAGLLAAFVIIGLGLIIMSKATTEEKKVSLLKVGISVNREDQMSRMALGFLEDYDSVSSVCQFVDVESEKIVPLMKSGELDAAILIPDSFVEDADSGENTPATFYFPSKESSKNLIFRELIMDAMNYIQTSQAVVYSAFNVAAVHTDSLQIDYYEIGDYLAEKLLSQWGKKDQYFENRVVSPFGSFDYYQFYIFVGMIVLLLLQATRMGYLYDKPARAMEAYLKHKGIDGHIMTGIRCLTVFLLLMTYTGLYYLLLAAIRVIGRFVGADILTGLEYPLNLLMTAGLCLIITFANHCVRWLAGKRSLFFPNMVRYIAVTAALFGLLFLVGAAVYRKSEVNTTGIAYDKDSRLAAKLAERIKDLDSSLDLRIYDDIDKLEADVALEKIDNGFFIDEDEEGKFKIQGMSGAFSFGSLVAQESIYTQIYAIRSEEILLREADQIFVDGSSVRQELEEELIRQKDSNEVLQPLVEEVTCQKQNGVQSLAGDNYKMMSIFAGLLLLVLLANDYEKILSAEGRAVLLALRGNRRFVIRPMIITALLLMIALTAHVMITGRGSLGILFLFPLAIAYTYLLGGLFSDRIKYRQFKGTQLLLWLIIVVFMI